MKTIFAQVAMRSRSARTHLACTHWDEEDCKNSYSCPQCRKTFTPRPVLLKSTMKSEVSRVKELQEKLEQEITELKRKDAELKKLSHTEDHNDVTAAVSEVREELQDVLREKRTNVSLTGTEVDVLLPQPEPKTRAGFLKYSREITLDPNTAHTRLLLSEGNRKATLMSQQQSYSSHPDRFTNMWQVLSRESLTGCCYWEVERRGGVFVAVAYKNISRAGLSDECGFGRNDKSWALDCINNSYTFYYNKVKTPVSGPESSRVGVYLDHSAERGGSLRSCTCSVSSSRRVRE
ncbi:tripartite motif-containing protein 16-like protein [Perca fluviatilis]|uniref:tripartite motif-containing protein 16-like protein n=1 Tax=Perca fluviatilis TaxID=8168 RepID=UPI0019631267|nr:tripartite motif-containing protein 16-like protein [Perca fluviatilis]